MLSSSDRIREDTGPSSVMAWSAEAALLGCVRGIDQPPMRRAGGTPDSEALPP